MIEPQEPTATSAGIAICDIKGIPVHRRKLVEAAVISGALSLSEDHEAWIVPARKPPAYSVRIVGPRGFYREVRFAGPESEAEIESQVRRAIER